MKSSFCETKPSETGVDDQVGPPHCGSPAPQAWPFALAPRRNSTRLGEIPARSSARAGDGAARHPYRLNSNTAEEEFGLMLAYVTLAGEFPGFGKRNCVRWDPPNIYESDDGSKGEFRRLG